MRVLLLSAYAAQSHVYWRTQLQTLFPDWQWRILELPPRHFSWRVRGNPLHWSVQEREALEKPYDLILATSMVDLATLRGLTPALCKTPTILYFHENQFAYPGNSRVDSQAAASTHNASRLEAQMVSLYASLAADCLVFNSNYNRDSFLAGLSALLARLPDLVPPDLPVMLEHRSEVVPVPLSHAQAVEPFWPSRNLVAQDVSSQLPLRLLWQGRFEFDKGPDQLLHTLRELESLEINYELALIGQQFRQSPDTFAQIELEFEHRLVHFGYVPDRQTYQRLLCGAHVALSTALHEFQGLALMEAVAAGCLPAVPDRVAYREYYPDQFRFDSSPDDPAREGAAAARLIAALSADRSSFSGIAPDFSQLTGGSLRAAYGRLFERVLQDGQSQALPV